MSVPTIEYVFLKRFYFSNKDVYERILCECLNKSSKMREFGGGNFKLIEQCNKAPDVIAENTGYGIDFKLMVSESFMEFQNRTAPIIQEVVPGVKFISPPLPLSMNTLLLYNCCRNMTNERLNDLRSRHNMESKNVVHFFDSVINHEKNVLLFIPVCFSSKNDGEDRNKQCKSIMNEVSSSTQYIFDFRHRNQPDFDTFLVYLTQVVPSGECNFVLSLFTSEGLNYMDTVNIESVSSMAELAETNSIF